MFGTPREIKEIAHNSNIYMDTVLDFQSEFDFDLFDDLQTFSQFAT